MNQPLGEKESDWTPQDEPRLTPEDWREFVELIQAYRPKKKKVSRYPGDKLGTTCPVCRKNTFGYHAGRFKDCSSCGFDNYWHNAVRYARNLIDAGMPLDGNINHEKAMGIYDYLLKFKGERV